MAQAAGSDSVQTREQPWHAVGLIQIVAGGRAGSSQFGTCPVQIAAADHPQEDKAARRSAGEQGPGEADNERQGTQRDLPLSMEVGHARTRST
ncbi:MAG: hypothetical protein QOI10_4097 [Solirubrobacterales bacterium]|nr:hypothetical protein [Solirubrobacterales bacterium]